MDRFPTKAQEREAHRRSFLYFSLSTLPHYFDLPPGDFHFDLTDLLADPSIDMLGILGFRGSAKTTFSSLALVLWCALTERYKFPVLINDTSSQMDLNLANVKYELDHNKQIKKYYPHIRSQETWAKHNLLLTNGVRIVGRSRGQKVRGIRHRQHRPDLVIVDDPEDLQYVQKKENRDKSERWLNSEVIPAVKEDKSKLIVIGNLLHTDALMARIKKNNLFKMIEFPLITEDGHVTWQGKYPTQESLDKQKKRVGEIAWLREYLLKVVPEEGQIIKDTDIVKYPNEMLTSQVAGVRIEPTSAGAGVDLAISEKKTADCTAMVSGIMSEDNGSRVLYIRPNPVNERIGLPKTVETARALKQTLPIGARFFVENVAYQQAAIDELTRVGLPVIPMRPITDKRARLETASIYIKNGSVRFPEQGCEDLLLQLLGFGVESHDDLVDALVYLILGMFGEELPTASVGSPKRL